MLLLILLQYALLIATAVAQTGFGSQTVVTPWDATSQSLYWFPEYGKIARQKLSGIARNLMNIYVHKEQKMSYHDIPDPQETIQGLFESSAELTDTNWQNQMSEAFRGFRDLHTNYIMPTPMQCMTWIYPIQPTLATVPNYAFPQIVVQSRRYYANQDIPFNGEDLSVGDHVLEINGKTIDELVEEYGSLSSGTNPSGSKRATLAMFNARPGSVYPPPQNGNISYKLKRASNGEEYIYDGRIFVTYDQSCIDTSPKTASETPPPPKTKPKPRVDLATKYNYESLKVFEPNHNSSYTSTITKEPILRYGTYADQVSGKLLGIIRLSSFLPQRVQNVNELLQIIADILTTKLHKTDALVWDIRDNGGGFVELADKLPQFFKRRVKPINFRMLVHGLNTRLLGQFSDWAEAHEEATTNSEKYTKNIPITPASQTNQIGTLYFKPVGVWTNGNCYSACDIFAANMQDNGAAAVIFGEDQFTGAGGANVIDIKSFLSYFAPDVFPSPLEGNQNMRVSWRQCIRTGVNEGKVLEDHGVETEVLVPPTQSDIDPSSEVFSNYQLISEKLMEIAANSSGQYRTLNCDREYESTINLGTELKFTGTFSGWKWVAIWRSGQYRDYHSMKSEEKLYAMSLVDDEPYNRHVTMKYYLLGFGFDKKIYGQQIKYIRQLPRPTWYKPLERGGEKYTWNFQDYWWVGTYSRTSYRNGWKYWKRNKLILGTLDTDENYKDSLESTFSFFVKLDTTSDVMLCIYLTGTYVTERDYDFIYIQFRNNNGELVTGPKLSGNGQFNDKRYCTNRQLTKYMEIQIVFESDSGVNEKGPTFTDIALEAVQI